METLTLRTEILNLIVEADKLRFLIRLLCEDADRLPMAIDPKDETVRRVIAASSIALEVCERVDSSIQKLDELTVKL